MLATFYQDQAIEPVGESKGDYDIHRMIGLRLGLEKVFPPAEEWMRKAYGGTLSCSKLGISWDGFKTNKKFVVYDCPTWEEWVDIKKEHGYGPKEGGLSWFASKGDGLETPSGKVEFVSSRIASLDPENTERPPMAKWVSHPEAQGSEKSQRYPLALMSNHSKYRFHVQGDDLQWIKELVKVRGPDDYMYEACWINPGDADARGISHGDIIMVHNERGGVLCGAVVTNRIIPGALSVDHGAKIDLAMLNGKLVDRGGSINMISPGPTEKYGAGQEVKIPEMNVSGYLVEAVKIDVSQIVASVVAGQG